jgi:hypothetical protein
MDPTDLIQYLRFNEVNIPLNLRSRVVQPEAPGEWTFAVHHFANSNNKQLYRAWTARIPIEDAVVEMGYSGRETGPLKITLIFYERRLSLQLSPGLSADGNEDDVESVFDRLSPEQRPITPPSERQPSPVHSPAFHTGLASPDHPVRPVLRSPQYI